MRKLLSAETYKANKELIRREKGNRQKKKIFFAQTKDTTMYCISFTESKKNCIYEFQKHAKLSTIAKMLNVKRGKKENMIN